MHRRASVSLAENNILAAIKIIYMRKTLIKARNISKHVQVYEKYQVVTIRNHTHENIWDDIYHSLRWMESHFY